MAKKEKPKVLKITDAAELTALVNKPLLARFAVDDQVVEIPCRRLTPAEEEQLFAIERSVRPRRIENKAVPGGFEFDTSSPEYQAAVAQAKKRARAMAIYMGCPLLAKQQPGLTDGQKITEFVQATWTEWVIEIVGQTIRSGGIGVAPEVEVNELANFTTSPDSDPS